MLKFSIFLSNQDIQQDLGFSGGFLLYFFPSTQNALDPYFQIPPLVFLLCHPSPTSPTLLITVCNKGSRVHTEMVNESQYLTFRGIQLSWFLFHIIPLSSPFLCDWSSESGCKKSEPHTNRRCPMREEANSLMYGTKCHISKSKWKLENGNRRVLHVMHPISKPRKPPAVRSTPEQNGQPNRLTQTHYDDHLNLIISVQTL